MDDRDLIRPVVCQLEGYQLVCPDQQVVTHRDYRTIMPTLIHKNGTYCRHGGVLRPAPIEEGET